ncbi:MAG: hypothetical protein IPO52_05950 [Gemmatimonadetes bacterium]|nr:hypothetical protein [Gemmatimonadota bacterium]
MLLPAVTALTANAILLLAMVAIYDLVTAKLRPAPASARRRARRPARGHRDRADDGPVPGVPGIQFAARGVLLGVAGLYAGLAPPESRWR